MQGLTKSAEYQRKEAGSRQKAYKAYMNDDWSSGDAHYRDAFGTDSPFPGNPGKTTPDQSRRKSQASGLKKKIREQKDQIGNLEKHKKTLDRLKGGGAAVGGALLGAGALYGGKKLYDHFSGDEKRASLGGHLGGFAEQALEDPETRELAKDWGNDRLKEYLHGEAARKAYTSGDQEKFEHHFRQSKNLDRPVRGNDEFSQIQTELQDQQSRLDNLSKEKGRAALMKNVGKGAAVGAGGLLLGYAGKKMYDRFQENDHEDEEVVT